MKIESPLFINRQNELDFFQNQAKEIAQGRGEDLFLISPWGRGKTALLKRLREILFWSQDDVLPIYFSFSRIYLDLMDFAEAYLISVISQILFFEQKERLLSRPLSPYSFSEIKREAERQGLNIIDDIIVTHQRAVRLKDERRGALNALAAPGRIAQAANKPVWMIVDHIQEMETLPVVGKGMAGIWRDVTGAAYAPHLFSGEPPSYLLKNLIPFLGPPPATIMELKPFPEEAEEELFQYLEKTYKVVMTRELSPSWFKFLDSNPGLFMTLLREARLDSPRLESHHRIVELYLRSLSQGELGRLYENRFLGNGQTEYLHEGRFLLALLYRLLAAGKGGMAMDDLLRRLDWTSPKSPSLIQQLEKAGLIWERFGHIGLEDHRVLKDWVKVMNRKHLQGGDLEQLLDPLGREIEADLSRIKEGEGSRFLSAGPAKQFSLVLPMEKETELVAVKALEQIATYSNLDENSIEQVKMALIEACINAGEHSQSFEKKIRVYFSVQPEAIEILVEDRGQAFDPVTVQARLVREAGSFSQTRGRGVALIKEMMDEVRFEKAEFGTRLYMAKKNKKEGVGNYAKF